MPVSKAQQRAVSKYTKANYDEIKLRIPKGERERIKDFAAAQGYDSVNAFIYHLVQEAMGDDKTTTVDTIE